MALKSAAICAGSTMAIISTPGWAYGGSGTPRLVGGRVSRWWCRCGTRCGARCVVCRGARGRGSFCAASVVAPTSMTVPVPGTKCGVHHESARAAAGEEAVAVGMARHSPQAPNLAPAGDAVRLSVSAWLSLVWLASIVATIVADNDLERGLGVALAVVVVAVAAYRSARRAPVRVQEPSCQVCGEGRACRNVAGRRACHSCWDARRWSA